MTILVSCKRMQRTTHSDLLGAWFAYTREPIVTANVNPIGRPNEWARWYSYVVYPQHEPLNIDNVAYRAGNFEGFGFSR